MIKEALEDVEKGKVKKFKDKTSSVKDFLI